MHQIQHPCSLLQCWDIAGYRKPVYHDAITARLQEEPEEEEKPQPPPEPEPPKKYIPVYLRPGGASSSLAPKPNVSSATDFPTLDAACTTEPAGKNKTPASPPHEDDDNAGWSQAGASQRPARAQNVLPIAVNTNPSVYVPPALRSGGSFPTAPAPSTRFESRQEFRSSRPRESMTNRPEGLGSGLRSEGVPARETLSTNFDGWSRGATIDSSKTLATGPSGGSPFSTKVPSPSRPSYTPANYSTGTNSGWARNVNVKTFKESGREKPEFELVQTNRFAGLEES
ncbi:unnamed protein product [Echinostoma caproni]|uniref:BAT2_N domain-containing protein n=1 Tax=Echinostoma caproni TaxID=27848 RepID=A0A183AKK0_9TREM|nr:unnamed protein product [Echinostoma caproni]